MKTKLFLGLIVLPLGIFGLWVALFAPAWKEDAKTIAVLAQSAGRDREIWQEIYKKAEDIPRIYPINALHNSLEEVQYIFEELEHLEANLPTFDLEKNTIDLDEIDKVFLKIKNIESSVKAIDSHIRSVPNFALGEEEQAQKKMVRTQIQKAREVFDQIDTLKRVLEDFRKNEERVLLLLQNQNEPRPTGGFSGSVMILDFTEKTLQWRFEDIYALDRRVPADKLIPAPDFFHNLSTTISMRDANISPDFAISAELYRTFFESIDEKIPDTVVGVNLNLVEELLKFSGPITFEQWNITANQYNFDMVLSFLVESKIAGRFHVKEPLLIFIRKIMQPERWKLLDLDTLLAFDAQDFLDKKNILLHSENKKFQRLIEHWNLDGSMEGFTEADNFLWADFVSVGANKTEKFMWTKLWHDAKILPSGKVLNTLEIQRRHNLQEGELDRLLGTPYWFENIRDQLNGEMRWKLAEGQNRTFLRLFVPTDARIITQQNPSGEITENFAGEMDAKIFEVPMYISTGEKNTIKIVYETSLKRGSNNWRPYFFKLGSTPGKKQTTFLKTISSEGQFSAETLNIGKPLPIEDQEYRAVVDFRE